MKDKHKTARIAADELADAVRQPMASLVLGDNGGLSCGVMPDGSEFFEGLVAGREVRVVPASCVQWVGGVPVVTELQGVPTDYFELETAIKTDAALTPEQIETVEMLFSR
jgi:hypothetical protein